MKPLPPSAASADFPPAVPLALSTVERIALAGLSAAWRLRQLDQQAAERELLTEIERRLELPPGSVGTAYTLDAQSGTLTPAAAGPPPGILSALST